MSQIYLIILIFDFFWLPRIKQTLITVLKTDFYLSKSYPCATVMGTYQNYLFMKYTSISSFV